VCTATTVCEWRGRLVFCERMFRLMLVSRARIAFLPLCYCIMEVQTSLVFCCLQCFYITVWVTGDRNCIISPVGTAHSNDIKEVVIQTKAERVCERTTCYKLDSFVDFGTIYIVCLFIWLATYFLFSLLIFPYLSTSLLTFSFEKRPTPFPGRRL